MILIFDCIHSSYIYHQDILYSLAKILSGELIEQHGNSENRKNVVIYKVLYAVGCVVTVFLKQTLEIQGQSSQLYLILPPNPLKTQTIKESDGTSEDLSLPHSHMIKLKGQPSQLGCQGKEFCKMNSRPWYFCNVNKCLTKGKGFA